MVRLSTAFHNYGDVFGRRGARLARREEGEYREYLTNEQRREAGCIAGQCVAAIVKRSTKVRSADMGTTTPRTVVFPAAGLGTRILPATKAFPKELLPLVDRPVIQYGVEEAVRSGIREVVLVTSPDNTMTAAHFAPNPKLEALLEERGKVEALEAIRAVTAMANVTTVHQSAPLGLGHAVLMSKDAVGDAPFAVALPDDVIDADPPALRQLCDVFAELNGPVVLVERVPRDAVSRYGIIDPIPIRHCVYEVRDLVEKPAPDKAPSDLGVVGRYVLTPDLFGALEDTGSDAGGEIQLTDGLRRLLQHRQLYACELSGVRHDVGTTLGYLKALTYFGLSRPDLAPSLREYLASLE